MECKNLLFIDQSVRDFQVFVDSVNTNTFPIVYDPLSSVDMPDGTFDRIGIVFVNTDTPSFLGKPFFDSILPELIRTYQVKTIDFLACSTLLDPLWIEYYAYLTRETGVLVGASDDLTGNVQYGGDWVMENTLQDIETVYFTEKIEYYQYLLDFSISTFLHLQGILWGVGNNAYGQLGTGDTLVRTQFINITERQSSDFQNRIIKSYSSNSNSTGYAHTVVLMEDGSVWGAGANNLSQLGSITTTLFFQPLTGYTGIPYLVATGPTHTMIATKNNTSYELWAAGSITTYGANYFFNGATRSTVFLKLTGYTSQIVSIVSNQDHQAILYGNSISLVGQNVSGQLGVVGTSGTINVSASTVEATTLSTFYLYNGNLYGTGATPYNGSSIQTNTFQLCATNVSKISAGIEHVLLLKQDNTLWGCGLNTVGQLTLQPGSSFTQIPFPYGTIQSIQSGWKQSIVMNTDNRIFASGSNIYGQLGTSNTANLSKFQEIFTPILFTPSIGTTRTVVTVTGVNNRNFSSILVGGNNVSSTVYTNSVVFQAPSSNGNASISVQYKTSILSSAALFTYQNASVTSRVPSQGLNNTLVTINGSYLNPVRVLFGTTDVSFSFVSGIVNASAPIGSGNVSIYLIDPLQNTTWAGMFLYQNASVTSIVPSYGTARTSVKIQGNYLNPVRVLVGTTDVSFTNVSGINFSVPSGTGNVSIYLIDANQTTWAGTFLYQNASITSLDPSYGPARTPITIQGEYLNPVRALVGTTDVSFTNVSGIRLSVPAGTGNTSVYLIDPLQNTTWAGMFLYQNASVTSLDPSYGPARTPITIQGEYLNPVRALVGTTDVSFTNVSGINLSVPAGTGNTSVYLIDALQNTTWAGMFLYQNASITSLDPSYGTTRTPITIEGEYLNPVRVIWGTNDISFSTVSGIHLSVPAGTGNVSITLIDDLKNDSSAGIFSYHNPSLISVTALAGPTETVLSISGDYLDSLSYLDYNGTETMAFVPLQITIPNAVGYIPLIAIDTLNNEWDFGFDVTSLIPNVSLVETGIAGDLVTLYGSHLEDTTLVTFGQNNASIVQAANGFVKVIVPPGNSSVNVSILDTRGYTAQSSFMYITPKITSLSVVGAPSNTDLTLRGVNLLNTTELYFGNTSTRFVSEMSKIQASVPLGTGNVSITAVDSYGQLAIYPEFTFRNPIITDLRPRFAPSKSALTITGDYLSEISTVYFGDIPTKEFAGFLDTLYVTVPVSSGTVVVRIVDRYGNQTISPVPFTYDGYPISRIFPLTGVVNDFIQIESPDFTPITSVTFGGLTAQVYPLTNQFWIARAPGPGKIIIKDALGKCGIGGPFTTIVPTIESINNNVIQGTGFQVVESVVIGTRSALVIEKTDTLLHFEPPPGEGTTILRLIDTQGNRIEYPYTYLVDEPFQEGPIVFTSMTPAGPDFLRISIRGENFLRKNGSPRIQSISFQNALATQLDIVSSSLLYCTVPDGTGTAHMIAVDDLGGSIDNDLIYFYLVPMLSDVSPNQGSENMYIYLYGSLLHQIKHVLIGEANAKINIMDNDCIQVRIPPGQGTQSIALVDLGYNVHLTPYEFTYSELQSRICFPAGTTVQTDQGILEIQLITSDHTIEGKRVVALTKTYGMDADLVCFKRGAIRKNYPTKRTVMTRCHRLWLKGELVSAQRLLDQPGVSLIPYEGEKLYNVLLEEKGRMKVHGMWVETLDPINPIAKFFRPLG
jgi:hypothetical protein